MLEKRDYLEKNLDQIRTMVLQEPGGHNDMFGAALVEPINPDADLSVIFLSRGNYPRAYPYMCGHGAGPLTPVFERNPGGADSRGS